MITAQTRLSLQSFFSRSLDSYVALIDHGQALTCRALRHRSLELAGIIADYDEQNWGLFCHDAGRFIISLLALLAAGKTIYLPANNQPGTLTDLSEHADIFLTDGDGHGFNGHCLLFQQAGISTEAITELALGSASLVFFTSGSSGKPKAIRKQLWQLENEVTVLEQQWGEQLKDAAILAGVAHQHIYGVLFRVLWPLLAGRPIDTRQYYYPETLLAAIASYKNVAVVLSPAQLERLPEELDWSQCRHKVAAVFSSGAPLQRHSAMVAARCFSVLPLEILGSTETGGVAWRQQWAAATPWQPLPGVQVRLDQDGLLIAFSPWIDSPQVGCVMGDRAEIRADQSFILKGRADQIIKIAGIRLSLTKMTERLNAQPLVAWATVLVLNNRRQHIGAILVLSTSGWTVLQQHGRLHTIRLLKQGLARHFDAVTLPKKWRFVPEKPVNTQGKLIHKELTELFNSTKGVCHELVG